MPASILLAVLLAAPAQAADAPEAARVQANLASYVSDGDYPAEAIRAGEQGTVRFRLDVGENGRVSACTITESSGSASLDGTTCRILTERARFLPARDSEGKPTTDSVHAAIRWVLPEDTQPNPLMRLATNAWIECLNRQIVPHLGDNSRSTRQLLDAASPACRAEEEEVAGLVRAEWPEEAEDTRDQLMRSLREAIIEAIDSERNGPQP